MHRLTFALALFILLLSFSPSIEAKDNEFEPVHYAFSNYLGNGIYTTSNQKVTLINLPFSYQLQAEGKLKYHIRLPVSVGFFDFSFDDIPELEFPDKIGTLTFTPGIGLDYQLTDDWSVGGYFDLGAARNYTTKRSVVINSFGLSAQYDFDVNSLDSMWITRLYTASYDGISHNASDGYSAIQTGIDFGLPTTYSLLDRRFQPRFYAAAFWYFNNIDFFRDKDLTIQAQNEIDQVSLTDSYEVGVRLKFEKIIGWSGAGVKTIGLGYRFTKDFSAIRFVFSMPI